MRLDPGTYLGETLWERRCGGLLVTLSAYRRAAMQPWHCHANPTFFLLLAGDHRDHTRHDRFDQPAFSLVYHPTTKPHAGELGPRGMRGLNIEYDPTWLHQHGLQADDLGGYLPLASAEARLAALRFAATAFQDGPGAEADLQTQALELLEPLAVQPGQPVAGPAPRWLRTAEDYLHAHFRQPVSLRDVATEVGVHPVYLARVFRRRHGLPVSGYLRALRLVEAGRLVLDGVPLVEAAFAAGFADQPHFSRSFSREFGFSPRGLWPARAALRS
jgi:AraC family transcriptional regulator